MDSYKIAFITDQHFGAKNNNLTYLNYQFKFYNEVFFPELEKQNVKELFILGDTWDSRTNLNIFTYNFVLENFFERLHGLNIPVHMINGNHDVYFKNTNSVNSIKMLSKMFNNINYIDHEFVWKNNNYEIGLIGWINNENYEKSMKFINEQTQCNLLCGHFEIMNFEISKGNICQNGFDKKIFDRYSRVFSGHFHPINDDGRILYLGNPYEMTWDDYKAKRGFWIMDVVNEQMEHIKNPFTFFEKIVLKSDDFDILSFDYEQYRDKFVKVFVDQFNQNLTKKINLFIDKLSSIVYEVDLIVDNDISFEEIDIYMSENGHLNNESLIEQYIDSIITNSNLEKNKLKQYFFDILKKVNNQ